MRNPPRDDREYVQDILERIQRIETFVASGRDEFFQSVLIQDAVMRNFEVIGEATKRLSHDFREQHPNVPWKQMAGFRDVLIHDYMGLQLEQIWATIEQSLPTLRQQILEILQATDPLP
ncbi:DUF86 domain-containing protein [Alkalinema pantanalense CENA528]|uniref:HepT-like ribonuclease domain-containing protein n=1 Tax=Alkalinema pantanalense TaxID=1620705 RepID=UPI003D6F4836